MARCPDCYGSSDEIEFVGDGKCRECFGTGKDQSLIDSAVEARKKPAGVVAGRGCAKHAGAPERCNGSRPTFLVFFGSFTVPIFLNDYCPYGQLRRGNRVDM